ncbi:MAG: hypothetical protein K0Q56_1872, partial [Sporolactobacillus laevolacticus]|nr:hypothetical protein [Sporolactobacillus laevolacticus]
NQPSRRWYFDTCVHERECVKVFYRSFMLRKNDRNVGGKIRKYYRTTEKGTRYLLKRERTCGRQTHRQGGITARGKEE